jgi:hypothetical protein
MAVERNVGRCRFCRKRIQRIEGVWHHVWWGRRDDGVSVLCGSRSCAWREDPSHGGSVAHPLDQ